LGKKDEKGKKVKSRRRRRSSHWKRVDGSGGGRQWRRSGGRKASETCNKRCQMRVKKKGFLWFLGRFGGENIYIVSLWGGQKGRGKPGESGRTRRKLVLGREGTRLVVGPRSLMTVGWDALIVANTLKNDLSPVGLTLKLCKMKTCLPKTHSSHIVGASLKTKKNVYLVQDRRHKIN
jgi:hypothetical protein